LEAEVDDPNTGLPSKASNTALAALEAEVDDPNTGLPSKASNTALATAEATAQRSSDRLLTDLQASLASVLSEIQSLQEVTSEDSSSSANSIAARALDGASLKTLSSANFHALTGLDGLDLQLNPDLLGLTVARASRAWNPNWTGLHGDRVGRLVEYGPNRVRSGDHGVVRETAAATNGAQNPRMEGGVVGTLTGGSPTGTIPTRMVLRAEGATVEFIGYEVTAGRTEALFRFSGTPTGNPILYFDLAATAFASVNGDTRTGQATVRLASGSMTNTAGVAVRMQELTSAGANVAGGSGAFITPDAFQRCIFLARTLSGGGTVARARHGITIDHTSGAIDLTLAVSVPQFESGLVATTPGLPPPGEPGEFTRAAETFTFGAFETVRASRETYRNADGSITNFLPNTVAYGTDGIQITNGSTNLWTRSDNFANAVWTKTSLISVTGNVARAPDGEMTADRVTASAGTGTFQGLTRTLSVTSGLPYTASYYVAYDGSQRYVQLYATSTQFGTGVVNVDLLTGQVVFQATGTSSGLSVSAEKRGRFVRVRFTAVALATGSATLTVALVSTPDAARGSSQTYAGGESILIWGGQAEVKSWASPAIKTVAATVSRAGLSKLDVHPGSWFNPVQGYFFADFLLSPGVQDSSTNPFRGVLGLTQSVFRGIGIRSATTQGVVEMVARDDGGISEVELLTGLSPGQRVRAAVTYSPSDLRGSANGAAVGTGTARTPNVVLINLGRNAFTGASNSIFNDGLILREIGWGPDVLTNDQLRNLSAL
jgi:hypothetical protein